MAQNVQNIPSHQPTAQPSPAHVQQHMQEQISTQLIQQYLDENDTLIAAIFENMNANRLKDCVQYQARLQQNLMYLAAIADQNPQAQQQQ